MTQYLPLPDGNSVKIREGESPEQAWSRAQQMYPESFGGKKEEGVKRDTKGFKAAAAAGLEQLGGEFELLKGKLGFKDQAEAQKEYEAAQERAKARFTPTEEGWTEAPWQKFKETLGGSLPYMAAPAAAGLAALAAPVSAPVAAAIGAGAAGLTSAGQFTATNLGRQMGTGKTLEQTDLGAAFAAAVPQALMDTAAMALLPGVGKLFGSVGSKLTVEEAKAIANQTLTKTLGDYAIKTGGAMSREGFTEAAQQALERVQAGLSITDPEARKEYIDSFIGGAALAGVGAPVGRYMERGAAKDQAAKAEQEEKAAARKAQLLQQEQERAAAEAEKNTPEYALRVADEFETLLQQKNNLLGQRRKGTKDKPLTEEDKAFNSDLTRQLQELQPSLTDLGAEKNRVTQSGLLAQAQEAQQKAQEEQRKATLSPEEYAVEQAAAAPVMQQPKAAPVEGDPFEMVQPVDRVQEHAANLKKLADTQMLTPPTVTDYVAYAMKEPLMADQMVKTATAMPGMNQRDSAAFLGGLKLQLQQFKSNLAQSSGTRLEQLAQEEATPPVELPAAEEAFPENKRLEKVMPETYALQRIAQRPAAAVRDEDKLPLQVDALVDTILQSGPAPAGRVVPGAANEAASKADTLRAQLSYANATDNRERANELKKQLADLNEPDTEKAAGDIEFGQAAKTAGVEGQMSPDAMRANRITRLSNNQMQAYDRLADFVQRVREGDQDVTDARKQTLTNAAQRLKETVVGLALNEIDARRAQAGMAEMALQDKVKAVGQLSQTLDELIERGAGMFQKPVERKAQMRGTQIVSGALEDVRQPVGRRVFNNYDAAAKSLRGQLREDIDRLGGFVPQEAKERPPRKLQKESPLLKTQWSGASEREISEQFAEAIKRADSEQDKRTLEDIQSKFKNLSDVAQDEALIQVRRVENGLPLEVRGVLKEELADLRAAGVSDTGQAELFPGESEKAVTRSTPARFMALLGSKKIAELKAKLAEENRVLAFQAKRAATMEAKAKKAAEEAEAFQQKLLASNAKSPVQKAKEALTKLTGPESKAVQATKLADQIVVQRNTVRTRIRSMIQQIEDAERKAKTQVKDVQTLLAYTQKQLDLVQTEAAKSNVAPSMSDLALWSEARANQEAELKKAQKTLDAVQKSLMAARATLDKVTEEHASDVIDNSIIREGEKAQRKIDTAKAALDKAMADERAAARVLEAEKARKAVPEATDQEKLEAFAKAAGADSIRVYRDTADPSVQAKVTAERKNIARAEEAHDKAQAAGDKEGMELALKQIEAAYDKVYEILNNAPVRRDTTLMASHVEAFDRAQTKTLEQTAKLFEEKAGIKPLKMAERRTVASVRNVKSGRLETQIKKESVAAQEARVKKEQETGQYPARALEELAKARAERNEVQAQIDYIDNNPAAPRSEAKARQIVARKKAVEKRKALDSKIKQLSAAQKEVVAEAKVEKQAEQALRREKQRMVRSAGRLQEAVGEEGDVYEERGEVPSATAAPRKVTFAVKTPAMKNLGRMSRLVQKAEAKRDTSYEFDGLTYKDAAQRMADTSTSDADKAFFERLVEVFEVLPDDAVSYRVYGSSQSMGNLGTAAGVFATQRDAEAVFVKTGLSEERSRKVLMHELAHAASVHAIKAYPELDAQITKLREKVEAFVYSDAGDKFMYENFTPKKMDGYDFFQELYGFTNNKEFIAEAYSNPGFQKILAEIPSDKPKLSIFSRLVQYLANALGLSGKAAQSTLAEALSLTEKLFNKTRNEIFADTENAQRAESVSEYNETALTDLADKIVAKPKTFKEQIKDIKALELEMAGVDARAALSEVIKRGADALGDDRMYTQAMSLVRKRDDLMSQVHAVMENGAPELYRDEKGFLGVRTSGKDTARDVYSAVADVPAANAQDKFSIASTYLIALRAADKGLEKLDIGALGLKQSDLDAALAAANADPEMRDALEEVARRYKSYNRGLVNFLADTGAIPKKMAEELLRGNYVPFYRVRANGVAELVFSDKMVFTVGDIRNQPYLAELKGGEEKIMPLNESLPRNTMLLVDKALTNLAERNVAYALQDIGKGKGPVDPKTGKPKDLMTIHKETSKPSPDDARVIRFNQEPDPRDPKDDGRRWLMVESDGTAIEGVPAELVVKSLEGASLPLPGFLKLAGAASDLLRTGVTRTPLYIARQLYKEPMAAAFTGGLNYSPFRAVLEAGKEYIRMMRGTSETHAKLIEKGLIQSQIFSGSPDDMKKVALQLARGGDQSTINKLFGALDRAAINADAATRALIYDNARKNGLSEVEAEHAAREAMNFSKRGSNAAVQYASRLIPFMNAQIQSLNVLYKAMTGQMPFEEQLRIKRKFMNNAMLLFATGIVYAMAMEDDEYFKNARPRDKYTNFFLHLPGVEEPIKIATPFEAGYFFSLAVAAVDGMKAETNNAEQFAALRDMFLSSIPGYSSAGMPQIVKPAFEVWTNKNFLTGAPIESMRLRNLETADRYTESTTEFAKAMSRALPVLSPVQIEHIVRGYLGVAPIAAAAMINGAVPTPERGEKPTMRASELPFLGSAFQRKMGGAQADEVYNLAEAAFQARGTYNERLKSGRAQEAKEFREERKVELAMAAQAGQYRQLIGRLNADIRRTQNRTDLSGDEKRARLDRLEDAKTDAAKKFLQRYRDVENRLGD